MPICWPSNTHCSMPSSPITTCGTPVAVLRRRRAGRTCRAARRRGRRCSRGSGRRRSWRCSPRSAACPHRIPAAPAPQRSLRPASARGRRPRSAESASGRPDSRDGSTASATSSSLVDAPAAVVLEADAEMTTACQRERGEIGGEEVVAERPSPTTGAGSRRAARGRRRATPRSAARPNVKPPSASASRTAEVEAEHRARRAACRRASTTSAARRNPGSKIDMPGHEAVACRTAATGARCRSPRSRTRTTAPRLTDPGIDHADAQTAVSANGVMCE